MRRAWLILGCLCCTLLVAAAASPATAAQGGSGTIKGRVRLMGKSPGNSVIRMGVDPKCAAANKGKQAVQEIVKAASDGGLANVFVRLEGSFPRTPPPQTPVVIDQRDCFYVPRVAGVMVGQPLQIRNSDNLLHNVHAVSNNGNEFNVAQVKAGVTDSFKMKKEELMLRLGCDVHRWMSAYIGVVTNPYYAVSDAAGNFQINGVPPGSYTIIAWHERYGPTRKTVKVTAGATTVVDFGYSGAEAK